MCSCGGFRRGTGRAHPGFLIEVWHSKVLSQSQRLSQYTTEIFCKQRHRHPVPSRAPQQRSICLYTTRRYRLYILVTWVSLHTWPCAFYA